ncbi:DUF4276 family protein [Aliivibrio kagoshimensis]|uniref:DUF4276 family protein n=1 Tax=Aliivibrio kagoshimensis TaxID=2910230 RepID=UPI003D0AFF7A
MIRINVFVEGQTEETFVRDVLAPYFVPQEIYLNPILVLTSPGHKGGIVNYDKVRYQVVKLCQHDRTAYLTTLIDYYGLPNNFPAYDELTLAPASERVLRLEEAFSDDVNEENFIANFLLHEFEALLFCDPQKFEDWIDDPEPVDTLQNIKDSFATPEDINNSRETAPSKRILSAVPHYRKTLHGPLIAGDIGIDEMRRQCPHFNYWVEKIVRLNE